LETPPTRRTPVLSISLNIQYLFAFPKQTHCFAARTTHTAPTTAHLPHTGFAGSAHRRTAAHAGQTAPPHRQHSRLFIRIGMDGTAANNRRHSLEVTGDGPSPPDMPASPPPCFRRLPIRAGRALHGTDLAFVVGKEGFADTAAHRAPAIPLVAALCDSATYRLRSLLVRTCYGCSGIWRSAATNETRAAFRRCRFPLLPHVPRAHAARATPTPPPAPTHLLAPRSEAARQNTRA